MKQILIFGAGGQLGTELLRQSAPPGWELRGVTRQEADIADWGQVRAAVGSGRVGLVVNAAAYTAVDRAESEPAPAFAVNRNGADHCARAAAERGIPCVHVSTDYVFDGTKAGPYVEDDPIRPLGVYGRSKAEGEAAVRAAGGRFGILRTAWVFSAHGHNFVKTMLRLGREREELGIVDDQRGCPTAAADIAEAVLALGLRLCEDAGASGVYHYAGRPETTWFGFAQAIFEEARARGWPTPRLRPIATADYPTPARRPQNSVLDTSRIHDVLGIPAPDWRRSLVRVMDELERAGA